MKIVNWKILSVAAISSLLIACQSPTEKQETQHKNVKKNQSNEKIVVWIDKEESKGLESVFEKFEAQYGVKIQYEEKTEKEMMNSYYQTKESERPNIISLPSEKIGLAVEQNMVVPLEMKQEEINKYKEDAVQAMKYKGTLYGLPKDYEVPLFVYNKKMLDHEPKTFEEVKNISKTYVTNVPYEKTRKLQNEEESREYLEKNKITEEEEKKIQEQKYGFLIDWDDYKQSYPFNHVTKNPIFENKNGVYDVKKLNIGTEANKNQVIQMQSWLSEMNVPLYMLDQDVIKKGFENQTIASTIASKEDIEYYKEKGIDIGVAKLPLLNGKEVSPLSQIEGWYMTSKKENKEIVAKLMNMLNEKDQAITRFEINQELTPLKELAKDKVIEGNDVAKSMLEQPGEVVPNVPETKEVWLHTDNALNLIFEGKQTPEEAIKDAEWMIQKQIESNHSKK